MPRAIDYSSYSFFDHEKISIRIKTRKEREYSFPIRTALIHRLKVRMMPFKDAEKHAKVFMEKFMDIVALFLMPLSYVTFKGFCSSNRTIGVKALNAGFRLNALRLTMKKALACMIDFMFALSTLTNQAEVLKNTQKSALKSQLEDDVSSGSIAIGEYNG